MIITKVDKKAFLVSCITGLITFILLIIWFIIMKGKNFLIDNPDLKYFLPIWTVALMYSGFSFGKKYYLLKSNYSLEGLEKYSDKYQERVKGWKNLKLWYIAKYLKYTFNGTALVFPIYLLSYIEDSQLLQSNIKVLIVIGSLCLISFTGWKLISRNLKNKL